MTTHRGRRTRAAVAAMVTVGALAGCTQAGPEDPPSDTATQSPDATATQEPDETPSPTPTEEPGDGGTPAPVPEGFPDPETLVGEIAYDERGPDGGWHTVVGGEPLDLALIFGSCFEGGTGDVCGYSISGSGPAGPDGAATPSEAALLLLLRSAGESDDGTPTWEVLDATITRAPGDPALLQGCEGEDGIAIYPADDADDAADSGASETVPVAAAWGPDDDLTALVELDPAEVTCLAAMP